MVQNTHIVKESLHTLHSPVSWMLFDHNTCLVFFLFAGSAITDRGASEYHQLSRQSERKSVGRRRKSRSQRNHQRFSFNENIEQVSYHILWTDLKSNFIRSRLSNLFPRLNNRIFAPPLTTLVRFTPKDETIQNAKKPRKF